MPAIQLPYSFAGTLSFTPYSGGQPVPVPFNASGNFSSKSDDKYEIVGAQTKAVDFGTSPAAGAKVVLVIYEQGTAPVQLQIGAQSIELKPGGAFLYFDPSPTAGVTAASLITTADATVRCVVLG